MTEHDRSSGTTSSVNSRELILEILLMVTKQEGYSHVVSEQVLSKYQYLSKQERAFITRVSQGTLERMIELDAVIDQFSKTPVKKMKPVIRCILRSAVYEILYMDAVPVSASCNEAVKLAKRKGFSGLSGFVNGVLRGIARGREQITYPDPVADVTNYLSVKYSLPVWLVQLWQKSYSTDEIAAIGESFLKEKPLCVRVNTAQTTPEKLMERLREEQVEVRQDAHIPYALYLSGYDYLAGLNSFREGDFYVQDLSSMLVAEYAGIQKGMYVMDVCGAPGGKSIHIAQLMEGTGHVDTRDVSDYKVSLIEENIRRCRVSNMSAHRQDATVADPDSVERADVVIADLPCSGLGVLGKKPDIKYRMDPAGLESLAGLQRQILDVVCTYVKPGGALVYSTCTIDAMENEQNVEWFCRKHPEYHLEQQRQILPQEQDSDGFFIAKLRKE
ncbi:MAG: 16S rRNA (cytosine(967)-C(5))-methyltransferase RsmB [Roseburia sp.]